MCIVARGTATYVLAMTYSTSKIIRVAYGVVQSRVKTAVLLGHGFLPSVSYNGAIRNFKDSPLKPTRPDEATEKANKNALEGWNVETKDTKLVFDCDCPFQIRTRDTCMDNDTGFLCYLY